MDMEGKSIINRIYTFSFMAVLVLLPWSLRWSLNAFVVTAIFGLLTTSFPEKIQRLRNHKQILTFALLFGLYLVGLLYTNEIQEGLISVEQKSALLLVPLIVVTSVSFSDRLRKSITLSFVYSNLLLSLVCIFLNIFLVAQEEPYPQLNFDAHTLAHFNQLHGNANPAWMIFSYTSLGSSFIPPTYFSVYLVLSILIIHFYEYPLNSFVRHLIIAWFSIVIVLLSSRMGILILFCAGAFVMVTHFLKNKFSQRESIFFILISGVLCALILISPVTRFRVIEEPLLTPVEIPSSSQNWNSVNLRFLEWKSGVEGIKDHGILGTGTGGTLDVLLTHYDKANLGDFYSDYNAHNQYIETYLEIGLLGFISLLFCFLIPLLYGIKNKNRLLTSLVIIVGFVCLSECFLERGKGIMLYVLFVSLFMFTEEKYGYSIKK